MASGARCSVRRGHGRCLAVVLALAALASPRRHGALAATTAEGGSGGPKWHVVSVSSLLPSTACTSAKAAKKASALTIVHRHGPCSPLPSRRRAPSYAEILDKDRDRVDSIHRRIAGASSPPAINDLARARKSLSLPARWGTSLGTTNYVTTVGLGTPARNLTVEIDTGSEFSWVQCKPCARCYEQHDPLFDPARSSTYSAVPCRAHECQDIEPQSCAAADNDVCRYDVVYGDNSHTNGTVVRDALTLAGSSHTVPSFLFGCGHDDAGLFGEVDGLFGLGRTEVSMSSQVAARYGGGGFSYCLPSSPSAVGFLTFGGAAPANTQYTEMATGPEAYSYYLNLIGIKVAGRDTEIPAVVFATGGTIIDSGTVISCLPPRAYAALRSAFVRSMGSEYKRAPPLSFLDTCYNFTGHTRVKIPSVELVFAGGTTVSLNARGVLFVSTVSQTCLGFASTGDETSVNVLGNTQQKTFTVVYDLAKQRIGFGAKGCD